MNKDDFCRRAGNNELENSTRQQRERWDNLLGLPGLWTVRERATAKDTALFEDVGVTKGRWWAWGHGGTYWQWRSGHGEGLVDSHNTHRDSRLQPRHWLHEHAQSSNSNRLNIFKIKFERISGYLLTPGSNQWNPKVNDAAITCILSSSVFWATWKLVHTARIGKKPWH